jgi:hypothetical protein
MLQDMDLRQGGGERGTFGPLHFAGYQAFCRSGAGETRLRDRSAWESVVPPECRSLKRTRASICLPGTAVRGFLIPPLCGLSIGLFGTAAFGRGWSVVAVRARRGWLDGVNLIGDASDGVRLDTRARAVAA